MHIRVEKEKILKALEVVSRISTKHQTLPVLQCVLLCAEDAESGLVIKATNLELGAETTVEANIKEAGTLAVPSALLLQTVQLVNERTVILKTEGDTLVIETGKSRTTIKALPHEEFPAIQKLKSQGQQIKSDLFVLGIRATAFAASQSSIKPELGSIFIHQQREQTLTFVATDAFRLAERIVPQVSVTLDHPILVPHKNALEVARILELVEGDPNMLVSENQLAFVFKNGTYVTTRLTEASFPDYQQIIPKEFATTATILRGDLVHALKKTGIFANTYLQVRVSVDPKANTVLCVSDSDDSGKTQEPILGTVEGEELSLSFNQRYLSDPLTLFADDSVVLRFAGVGRPMVIEGVSEKMFRYLIMPMNR